MPSLFTLTHVVPDRPPIDCTWAEFREAHRIYVAGAAPKIQKMVWLTLLDIVAMDDEGVRWIDRL